MNPAFTAVTRRKYVPVGSAPASLLETVTTVNTEFTSSEFVGPMPEYSGMVSLSKSRGAKTASQQKSNANKESYV